MEVVVAQVVQQWHSLWAGWVRIPDGVKLFSFRIAVKKGENSRRGQEKPISKNVNTLSDGRWQHLPFMKTTIFFLIKIPQSISSSRTATNKPHCAKQGFLHSEMTIFSNRLQKFQGNKSTSLCLRQLKRPDKEAEVTSPHDLEVVFQLPVLVLQLLQLFENGLVLLPEIDD